MTARASGAWLSQKSATGMAVSTRCAPASTVAASLVKTRVRLAPEDSASGGSGAPAPVMVASAGAAADAPSCTATLSAPCCSASACTAREMTWPGGAVKTAVTLALLTYSGPVLVDTARTSPAASAVAAPPSAESCACGTSRNLTTTPFPVF